MCFHQLVFIKKTVSFPTHCETPNRLRIFKNDWTLQWRQNERDVVPNHQPYDCLLNRLFRPRSKKTSKLRVTGLCEGNSPLTGEFPAQRASNAENVSIWWHHHEIWIAFKGWESHRDRRLVTIIQLATHYSIHVRSRTTTSSIANFRCIHYIRWLSSAIRLVWCRIQRTRQDDSA